MRRVLPMAVLAALVGAAANGAPPTAAPTATYRGVSRAAMIARVKASPLKLIDNLEAYCDGDAKIGAWLDALTASQTRSLAWSAGTCELANNLNPLDAGGAYCVQATLRLKHPSGKDDAPTLEFYLENPKHGAPGAVYAFRDVFVTDGEGDYERDRRTFEQQWRDRFKDAPPAPCEDE